MQRPSLIDQLFPFNTDQQQFPPVNCPNSLSNCLQWKKENKVQPHANTVKRKVFADLFTSSTRREESMNINQQVNTIEGFVQIGRA
jgi:hypothetical protein